MKTPKSSVDQDLEDLDKVLNHYMVQLSVLIHDMSTVYTARIEAIRAKIKKEKANGNTTKM